MRIIPLLLLSAAISCTDVPDSDLELQPTELKVRILDENFQQVTDQTAKVYLYRDYVSFLTKTGEVATAFVGKNGYANFTNLDPYNYFIYAVYTVGVNVYDNSTSAFNLFDYLTENAITTITVKTNLARVGAPTAVEISTIDIIPINENVNWVGQDYDTLWTEFMIIQDYDLSLKVSEQTIVAKSNSYFPRKLKFGEFRYLYPVTGSLETLELTLAEVEPYWDDSNPSKSNYVIYATFFTNKTDFINRAQIYSETISPAGSYESEFITVSDELLNSTVEENPYPQLLFLNSTDYQKNNYLIFTKLIWK
jgi:hypothetical protein